MKKKIVKLISVMLVLIMMLSLVGCASSGNSEKKDDKTAEEPVELVMWHPSAFASKPEDTFVVDAIAAYEKEHNVKITIVEQPLDNFDNLFKAANMAKNGPDIVYLFPGSSTVNYAPFLLSLNDYLTEDIMNSHFGWELGSEGYSSENEIYGIPFSSYVYVMYYNKALFKEAGLGDEDIPQTWDEFLTVCETLKQAGITPFVCGAKDGYIAQWGISALMCTMLGNDISLVTSGEPLAGTTFEEAADMWSQLGKNDYVNKDALSHDANGTAVSEFVNGKGAMYLNTDWVSDTIYEGLGEDMGIFAFPAAEASSPNAEYNYAGANGNLCVVNYSQHTEEAVEFVKYLTSAEFEKGYIGDADTLPNNTTLSIDDLNLSDTKAEMYSMIKEGKNATQVDLLPLNAFNTLVRNGSLLTMGKMDASEFTELVDEELAKE